MAWMRDWGMGVKGAAECGGRSCGSRIGRSYCTQGVMGEATNGHKKSRCTVVATWNRVYNSVLEVCMCVCMYV